MKSNHALILLFAAAIAAPAAAQEAAPQPEADRAVPRTRSDGESRNPNRPDASIRRAPRSEPPAERAVAAPSPSAPQEAPAAPVAPVAMSASADQQGGRRRPPSGGGGGGAGGGSEGAVRRDPGSRPSGDGGHGRPNDSVWVDRAVPRGSVSRPPRPVYAYRANPWPWYYDPWLYGGFGVGYAYYSPWNWYGPGWGYGGYAGPVYGRGYGYASGRVRLKVTPRDAEVFVDNYYAGIVDDFDGNFQGLRLEPGNYKIEVRKPGFESLTYDVHVQPDRTITFRDDLNATP